MIKDRHGRRINGNDSGYALVAALLILMLMTALGIWAMITSISDQRITGNMNEEQLMFFYAEQGVDRIASHLHYLDEGLFGSTQGLAYSFQDTSNVLSTSMVLNSKEAIWFTGSAGSFIPANNASFKLTAYVDPEDYEENNSRGASRRVAVAVMVENSLTKYKKAFRAVLDPRSVWDFAYYSYNHNPVQRSNYSPCNGASSSWYNCQSVFHQGESVLGDIYVRNANASPDNARFYMRGRPFINGQVRWRNLEQYDMGTYGGGTYSSSSNQTALGQSNVAPPEVRLGMKNFAKEVDPYINNDPTIAIPDMGILNDSGWWYSYADVILPKLASGYVYKIIFRNELDTDSDNCQEEGYVASAITEDINNGEENCVGDVGTFLLYRVPYNNAVTVAAAHYGNYLKQRTTEMVSVGGELYTSGGGCAWCNNVAGSGICTDTRINSPASPTYGAYNINDINGSYEFFYTPTQGTIAGQSDCNDTYNGIIFVDGDVLVSGIVDGKITIVATGNIIIDHEIEYEEGIAKDITEYASVESIDMLGLIALGDIIIPNSYPDEMPAGMDPHNIFTDDWSDATDGEGLFTPTGKYDDPVLVNDRGNEDIHAVMVSMGYDCTGTYPNLTCISPSDADIRNFNVGAHVSPRTEDGTPGGNPYNARISTWNDMGNDSGVLTIVGALIQNIPGRFGYDYFSGSNFGNSDGSTGIAHFIGHTMNLVYDPHLKHTTPAFPKGASASGGFPYGRASYDIISWDEISPGTISDNVW